MHYLALDLEMTGTEPGWHEIIQIGAALYDEEWNRLDTFLSNIYPENEESFSIPAQRVHDLSMDELEDAPMLHEVLEEFENWIGETLHIRQNDPDRFRRFRQIHIAGQSVVNDLNFMKFAYRDLKMKWPFSHSAVDLYNITYFLFPILEHNGVSIPERRSLEAVAKYFGLSRESEAHNALEDAVLTAECLKRVFAYQKQLRLEKEG